MLATQPGPMNADEFLAWCEGQTGRHELHDGVVQAMAPGTSQHALTKLHIAMRLDAEIRRKGLSCIVYPDGIGVRPKPDTVYEPDALVRCGPPLQDDITIIPDPLIVVEVASPSTQAFDAGLKLENYFLLPSLRHYLIVRPKAQVVVHYERRENGPILTRIIRDGRVSLDPPGIELNDVFAA